MEQSSSSSSLVLGVSVVVHETAEFFLYMTLNNHQMDGDFHLLGSVLEFSQP